MSGSLWIVPGSQDLVVAILPIMQQNSELSLGVTLLLALAVGITVSVLTGVLLGVMLNRQLSPQDEPAYTPTEAPPQRKRWPQFERQDIVTQCRILVLDDDGGPLNVQRFQTRGFNIDVETTVGHEMSNPYEDRYDLILLDQRGVGSTLGAKRGSDTLPLLRRDNPWIPIYLFTSYAGNLGRVAEEQVSKYATGVLRKSQDYEELEEEVLRALARHRSRTHFENELHKLDVANVADIMGKLISEKTVVSDLKFNSTSRSATDDEERRFHVRRLLCVAERVLRTAEQHRTWS